MQAEFEPMSSSLIDRLGGRAHRRAADTPHGAHAQAEPDGAHWAARMCARVSKGFPTVPRCARAARAPRRPVALLPELRRIVTRLDMPPRPRPAPRAPHPRTHHRVPLRTLNYHGAPFVKLLPISCACALHDDVFGLISI